MNEWTEYRSDGGLAGARRAGSHCAVAAFLMLACLAALTACRQTSNGPAEAQTPVAVVQPPKKTEQHQGGRSMMGLTSLLALFVSDNGGRWSAYDAVPGIAWRDAAAVENSDIKDRSVRFARTGTYTLTGFGEVDLPDGKTGVDAGVRRGNEGESGITLSGDAERVNEIAIVKFYPSQDYKAVLQKQLDQGAAVVLEADDCQLGDDGSGNTAKNAFYRIDLDGSGVARADAAHVEVYVDEAGSPSSPGSTTFVFYRSAPKQRIAELQCREV